MDIVGNESKNVGTVDETTTNSMFSSARGLVSNNKGLITTIGLAGAAAAYLLGTEHGRSMQSRINETMRSSMSDIRETVSNSLTKLRSTAQDVINRFGGEIDEVESGSVREKLRRVV
jgi:gas vesicle protein